MSASTDLFNFDGGGSGSSSSSSGSGSSAEERRRKKQQQKKKAALAGGLPSSLDVRKRTNGAVMRCLAAAADCGFYRSNGAPQITDPLKGSDLEKYMLARGAYDYEIRTLREKLMDYQNAENRAMAKVEELRRRKKLALTQEYEVYRNLIELLREDLGSSKAEKLEFIKGMEKERSIWGRVKQIENWYGEQVELKKAEYFDRQKQLEPDSGGEKSAKYTFTGEIS